MHWLVALNIATRNHKLDALAAMSAYILSRARYGSRSSIREEHEPVPLIAFLPLSTLSKSEAGKRSGLKTLLVARFRRRVDSIDTQ